MVLIINNAAMVEMVIGRAVFIIASALISSSGMERISGMCRITISLASAYHSPGWQSAEAI